MRNRRIALLQQFIKENPSDPFNKYALALEYMADGSDDRVRSLFDNLFQEHANYLPTYFQAAQFYWSTNEMEKADQAFKEGIELATKQKNGKALAELKSAYQNFTIEWDE